MRGVHSRVTSVYGRFISPGKNGQCLFNSVFYTNAVISARRGAALIEVSHLTKRYGEHVAVSDLCFTIDKGKITGFLGPNGAGKSTTMNILTGCLGASEGEVRIGGHDIFEEPMEAKRLIGYLPEQPPVYPDMTPREY